jgi:hypothetical protein
MILDEEAILAMATVISSGTGNLQVLWRQY